MKPCTKKRTQIRKSAYLSIAFFLVALTLVGCQQPSIMPGSANTPPGSEAKNNILIQTVEAEPDELVAPAILVEKTGYTKYGYINTKGQWVIAPQYTNASAFSEGYAVVIKPSVDFKVLTYCIIDKSGAIVAELPKGVEPEGYSLGYYESSSNRTAYFECIPRPLHISDGLFKVKNSDRDPNVGTKFGFANIKGEVVAVPQYDEVLDFCNGLAAVRTDQCWSYIDKQGKIVIPGPFTYAANFSEGLASVSWESKFHSEKSAKTIAVIQTGFIDTTGKIVISGQGNWIYPELSGPHLQWMGLSWDKGGNFFEGGMTMVSYTFPRGDFPTKQVNVIATLDQQGSVLWMSDLDQYYSEMDSRAYFNSGITCVLSKKTNEEVFIDSSGNIIPVALENWSFYLPYSEGLAVVKDEKDGLYKYINSSGKVITQGYKNAHSFINGYAFVRTSDNIDLIIDSTGAVVIKANDQLIPIAPFTK